MEYSKDPKTGLLYRPGTWDLGVIQEQRGYSGLQINSEDMVVDIGGNAGYFAWWALTNGAKFVYSIEPDPDNADLAIANLKDWYAQNRSAVEMAAVVPDSYSQRTVELYLNQNGTNKALHSTIPIRGRPGIQVDALHWSTVFDTRRWKYAHWTKVKIDIEGAEFTLPVWILPPSVQALAIEFHLSRKEFIGKAKSYDKLIQRAGFEPEKPLDLSTRARTKLMIYHRI